MPAKASKQGTIEAFQWAGQLYAPHFGTDMKYVWYAIVEWTLEIAVKAWKKLGSLEMCGLQVSRAAFGTTVTTPVSDVKNTSPPKTSSETWSIKEELIINAPFQYQSNTKGKNFRRQLLLAFNVWLQVDEATFEHISAAVDMLHNASLMIDDIEDGSALRRGAPAAHCVFGIAQTINSANYTYFLAQQKLMDLTKPLDALQIFTDELVNLHRGQGMDILWREQSVVPTEEQYLQMVANKTGGLFRLGVRLLERHSKTNRSFVPLADVLGTLFQIKDDYDNLCSEKMTAAKGFCEDLTEGKFSFPVIHSIHNSPDGGQQLLDVLKLHTESVALKSIALGIIHKTGSIDYTRDTIDRLNRRARDLISEHLPENKAMDRLLRMTTIV
ncbi:geranylgeranyl pyrophosphate synthetase [Elasticomyces elasticus]|nr:geranylgeranyl pyrophosphate synthetase [Elasticomyces elasticus]